MMLTEATTRRAKRPAKPVTLVGVDVYIITEEGIPTFDEYGAFKIEFISNRGTKVWPGYVSPDLMLVNWYRCRFTATRSITDADVDAFLSALTKKWKWSAAQKLWNYGDEAGFSKAY
ncbi:MAG: hypothetical protein ACYC9S_05485 [Leptospirales bacterium]